MIYAFDGRKPEIGKGVYINDHAIVIGDVKIGDGCYVGPGVILRGITVGLRSELRQLLKRV